MAVEPYDIIIPGNYFCDIIFTGIPKFPSLGTEIFTEGLTVVPGGIMNTVTGLSRLAVNVGWIGTLGNDFFSKFVADTAKSEGVDLSLINFIDESFKRVTVALSYPNDRAFVSYVDPVSDLVERVFEALETTSFKHLHFTGLTIDPKMPELIEACHAKGITVSMDCQHREETLAVPLAKEIISNLDIFMPNTTEAQRLTQKNTVEEAVSILRDIVPYLIIKDGVNGAFSWQQRKRYHAPAIAIDRIVDTTGAGDLFNAGFFAAHFANKSPEACLQWGNITGGLSLRGHGGYATSPTLTELQSYL
ncbi:MAG: PfkB family carbohydrate kinase [Anaerolineae bacterium]|nr:PfkB family carbohydrate kinase [Anaerolineae bacterium]MDQ7033850.1 PfkB family carbohydrate kinase [Anaerolineae bacterium]